MQMQVFLLQSWLYCTEHSDCVTTASYIYFIASPCTDWHLQPDSPGLRWAVLKPSGLMLMTLLQQSVHSSGPFQALSQALSALLGFWMCSKLITCTQLLGWTGTCGPYSMVLDKVIPQLVCNKFWVTSAVSAFKLFFRLMKSQCSQSFFVVVLGSTSFDSRWSSQPLQISWWNPQSKFACDT